MKRKFASFILISILLAQATAQAGYLPLAEPAPSLRPMSGTEFTDRSGVLHKLPNDPSKEYYWATPTAGNPYPIVSFPRGVRVVWDPAKKKPVGVVPGEEIYLNPKTNRLVRISEKDGVAFSSTGLTLPLRNGQVAYEDDHQRTSIVDLTEQYEIHFRGGQPYVGRAQKTGEMKGLSHIPSKAELEGMIQIDPNATVYASAEDAMRGVNPMNQKDLPRGESLARGPQEDPSLDFSSEMALPPPPAFPEGKTPVRGPAYDGIWERRAAEALAARNAEDRAWLEAQLHPSQDNANPPPPAQQLPPPEVPQVAPAEVQPPPQHPEAQPEAQLPVPPVVMSQAPPASTGPKGPAHGDVKSGYGYQQMHEVERNAAYSEAWAVFGPKDSKLSYREQQAQFEKDPRLAKFTQIYVSALKATQSALPPVKLAHKLGINDGIGDSDPTYVRVTRGMALDLVKKHYPEFWKKQ